MARPVRRRASRGNDAVLLVRGPALLVQDDVVDGVVDRPGRRPARELAQLVRVGLAPAELLEALAVGLVVGDEADARVGPGPLDDAAGELDDRELVLRADVEDVADRRLRLEQR